MTSAACTCLAYLMLVFVNGEQRRPLEFDTQRSCNDAKNVVLMQYPSSERSKVKLTCVKK